jgi:hypothetical protein
MEVGNGDNEDWIPAFAGMTKGTLTVSSFSPMWRSPEFTRERKPDRGGYYHAQILE